MTVTLGKEVARTPAASVICGTGVPRSVAVARGVGLGVTLFATAAVSRALGAGVVGFGVGLGVGGSVGASVRNGGGEVGSGSVSTAGSGLSATGG